MGVDDTTTRHCVCGQAVEERELPRGLHWLSGRMAILVHVETRSVRCHPDSANDVERGAIAKFDELQNGTDHA